MTVGLERVARDEQPFVHRGVAAADHRHVLVLEERRVARRAIGDAVAGQPLLAGHAQPVVVGAARDDDRPRRVVAFGCADAVLAVRQLARCR